MIYLDYSANTPVDPQVLEQFCAVERRCIGNANSHHQAGAAATADHTADVFRVHAYAKQFAARVLMRLDGNIVGKINDVLDEVFHSLCKHS